MPLRLFETRLGRCAIAWTSQGICAAAMLVDDADDARRKLGRCADGEASDAPPWVDQSVTAITAHLAGELDPLTAIPLDLSHCTPFRRRVYQTLRAEVGPGVVISYGELAALVGSPSGARAIGGAMANNPIPLIVPCHRVLASGGRIGGFSAPGTTGTKQRLLAIEGVEISGS